MGTYKGIRIDAQTNGNKEHDNRILTFAKEFLKEDLSFCWRKFSEETKWWPDDLMSALTKTFPDTMFRVDYDGVGELYAHFYLGGKEVYGYWVQEPMFPTVNKFKIGVKKEKNHSEMLRQKRLAQETARLQKEKADKEKAELELLANLKQKYEKTG